MSTLIVLLRHGVAGDGTICAGRRADPELTAEGRAQARAAVERLGLRLDVVWSSPARRARQTAEAWDLPVQRDARLAERDFGAWEGRRWDELWPTVGEEVRSDPVAYAAFTPPGGEDLATVGERVWAAVSDAAGTVAGPVAAENPRVVLLVTHAGPVRLAVGRALGLAPPAVFMLGAEHGRAAVLGYRDGSWTLEALGA